MPNFFLFNETHSFNLVKEKTHLFGESMINKVGHFKME